MFFLFLLLLKAIFVLPAAAEDDIVLLVPAAAEDDFVLFLPAAAEDDFVIFCSCCTMRHTHPMHCTTAIIESRLTL